MFYSILITRHPSSLHRASRANRSTTTRHLPTPALTGPATSRSDGLLNPRLSYLNGTTAAILETSTTLSGPWVYDEFQRGSGGPIGKPLPDRSRKKILVSTARGDIFRLWSVTLFAPGRSHRISLALAMYAAGLLVRTTARFGVGRSDSCGWSP